MANKPKRYDLKAADRKRNLFIQIGLTAVVVVFAVVLVVTIVANKKPQGGQTRAITVTAADKLVKNPDGKPKVVLSVIEDFLCPACANFERTFGPTVTALIDTGAVQADYFMVAILDRPTNDNYSSRAGGAGYCVADESVDAFRRFHEMLYKPGIQPEESGTQFPDNAKLIELARQAGVIGKVPECVNDGKYTALVGGMANAVKIASTPTIRINGEDLTITKDTTPQTLIDRVQQITGPVPGLAAAAPPAPPPAPVPAPAAP